MEINHKMLMDLAGQLGMGGGGSKEKDMKRAESMADRYKGKDESELLEEILSLKRSMKSDPKQYDKQMKAIKALRGMLSGEQRDRLDKVVRLLEQDD